MLGDPTAPYRDVVRPYLSSDDIADDVRQSASRWAIDFGLKSLEEGLGLPSGA